MLPRVFDLTAAKSGRGWTVGVLPDRHPTFQYLRTNVLCGFFADIGSVFTAINDLDYKPRKGESSNSGGDFYSTRSLADAIDLFTKRAHTIRSFDADERMLTAEDNIGSSVYYDVQGDFLDVGRYLEGSPEVFGVMHAGNPASLYVTILFNINVVSSVGPEAINHKQQELLRLVDWLESRQVRCKIRAFASTECCHVDIVLKDYGDPVDLNSVAVVSHSDFLRRILFLYDEQSQTWEHGYGSPRRFSEVMVNKYEPVPEDGLTVYIDDQSINDKEEITRNFDNCKKKIADVISSPEKRDFTRAYMVQL